MNLKDLARRVSDLETHVHGLEEKNPPFDFEAMDQDAAWAITENWFASEGKEELQGLSEEEQAGMHREMEAEVLEMIRQEDERLK